MPRNFSELKSGGGQFICCPPTLKSGGGDASPLPPPIDARAADTNMNVVFLPTYCTTVTLPTLHNRRDEWCRAYFAKMKRCRAYIFSVVKNVPVDVSAHAQ